MGGPPRLVEGTGPSSGADADAVRGRLRPHDPFELIRWLAFSQTDPRKALAELVQNSLDAAARTVRVGRFRERGLPGLRIFDDGEGVIPELDRREALRAIATTIGHSRKRSLSPQQRFELMTQGQYGIGLLGFWSIGERLEMRSAVPGQLPYRLILHRDRPQYRVEPMRDRLDLGERWTEVVVLGLFREAQQALTARRAADYLAGELRGQLIERDVELLVEDRAGRGGSPKLYDVRPPRFLGRRIDALRRIDVPGHAPARLEVYVAADDDDAPPLALYAGGTLVVPRFDELRGTGLDREPWTDRRLTGLIDFPELRVAPGSRRGVSLDVAGRAFAAALGGVAPVVQAALDDHERRREEETERTMVRQLQRAYRDFHRERPRFAALQVGVAADTDHGDGGDDVRGRGETRPGTGNDRPGADDERPGAKAAAGDLLPPGPLAALRLRPAVVTLATGGTRVVRAIALDAVGREVDGPVDVCWSVVGRGATVEADAAETTRARVVAGAWPGSAMLVAEAECDNRRVRVEVPIEVARVLRAGRDAEGMPAPALVERPGEPWRSRLVDGAWQVNTSHRDWAAVAERPSATLRYLSWLFAKEVVLAGAHEDDDGRRARLGEALEAMIEVVSFAERRLSRPGRPRR